VTDEIILNGATQREVVQIAASLKLKSTHPAAEAIAKKADDDHMELAPSTDIKSIAGKGVTGRFDEADFYIGNRSFLNGVVNSRASRRYGPTRD
jgi:cation transport ATPase